MFTNDGSCTFVTTGLDGNSLNSLVITDDDPQWDSSVLRQAT